MAGFDFDGLVYYPVWRLLRHLLILDSLVHARRQPRELPEPCTEPR